MQTGKVKAGGGVPEDQGICGIPPGLLFLMVSSISSGCGHDMASRMTLGQKMTKECMHKSYFKY